MELNKIYNVDCLEFMRTMPDKSVDLVLTDPPYGVGLKYDNYEDTKENLQLLINDFINEAVRVSNVVLITTGNSNLNLWYGYNYILAYYQPAAVSIGKYGTELWQPVLFYGNDPIKGLSTRNRWTVLKNTEPRPKDINHPCPKPLNIWIKTLLRGSANEGDIVFDPFMGSGTTAIACLKTNRKFIGCEISPKYCEIANKRIDDFLAQQDLFREVING